MTNLNEYYEFLADECYIQTEILDAITNIYGWNEETFDNITEYFTGYHNFEQLKESY